MQGVLLYSNGIITTNEAEKYIGQAYHLSLEHRLDDHKYIFYFLPILTIYTGLALKLGFLFTVGVQLLVNSLATVAFYGIAKHMYASASKSTVATLLFITFIPLQAWNSYLYTESLFYSFCVFFMYVCMVLHDDRTSSHVLRILVLLLLVFTRPLGLLFIPVLCIFYLAKSGMPKIIKWGTLLTVGAALYLLINFLYTSNADMDILMPQKQGMVICFGGQVLASDNLVMQTSNEPLNDLAFFIWHNLAYFSKLAGARLVSFFNLYRKDYSMLHNVYLIVSMVALYGFGIVPLIKAMVARRPAIAYLFFPLLVILCAGVMLQCDDFNSRFSMPLFPWIILLATDGMFGIKRKG